MNQQELELILKNHRKWLLGDGGEHADLRHANLSGANLSGANLRGADLRGADLSDANLSNASTKHSIGLKIISVDNNGSYNGKATFILQYNVVYEIGRAHV